MQEYWEHNVESDLWFFNGLGHKRTSGIFVFWAKSKEMAKEAMFYVNTIPGERL